MYIKSNYTCFFIGHWISTTWRGKEVVYDHGDVLQLKLQVLDSRAVHIIFGSSPLQLLGLRGIAKCIEVENIESWPSSPKHDNLIQLASNDQTGSYIRGPSPLECFDSKGSFTIQPWQHPPTSSPANRRVAVQLAPGSGKTANWNDGNKDCVKMRSARETLALKWSKISGIKLLKNDKWKHIQS